MTDVASPPLIRLRTGQKVLAGLVVVLLLLLTLGLADAARVRGGTSYASGSSESARTNAVYTMREGLNVALATQRYLSGAASRRDVQIARALLAQRLAVRDETGVSAGDAVSQRVPEFPVALIGIDEFLAGAPAGVLPASQRAALSVQESPVVTNLASAARRIGDVESAEFKAETAADQAATDHLQGDLARSLVLLLAILAAGVGLLGWLMLDMRSAVARGREELAVEHAELEALRAVAAREPVRG
jgi:hypothetical protein